MNTCRKVWPTALALALAAFVAMLLAAASQPARAAGPWYVAPGGSDGNDCLSSGPTHACATINGALAKATAGDTILVATGTYTGTGDQVVLLDKDATLSGGWNSTFTMQSGTSTIDGQEVRRGVTVNSGVTAIVERFAVQNGLSSDYGGGIYNDGTLTLNDGIVSGNTAVYHGGGVYNYNGTLTLNSSVVSDNAVTDVSSGRGGGVFNYYGTTTLNKSSITGNIAPFEGGGIIVGNGSVTLNNSTVSNNTASGNSFGYGYGGGIYSDGTLTLNNSTISGNTATWSAGGIYHAQGTVTLRNSIIARNYGGESPDCHGTIGTSGYNLVGDTSGCAFTPAVGDLTNINANLGQLIGAPGVSRYHPLLSNSPAIDAGNPTGCTDHLGNPLDTDQRGATRIGRCDIGAYEYTPPGPAASIHVLDGTPQRTPPFSTFETPFQALVLDGIGTPMHDVTVTFSAPASGPSGTFADSGASTTTAMTDESGITKAATFTANGLVGSYTVMAAVGGVITPADFLLSNIVGWYVAEDGNDANDCQSPTTPCATINGALAKTGFAAGDTVLVASGTYTGTDNEVALLNKSVRLLGGWDGTFTSQSGTSTLDGQGTRRGITVNSGVVAVVERFTIQNGTALYGYPVGGGIYNRGTFTLNKSTVSGNTAGDGGGGIFNEDILTLNDSTVSGNTVSGNTTGGSGGGIYNNGYNAVGKGKVTLNRSTVSGNTAGANGSGSGGGIYTIGGIYISSGVVVLNNSAIRGNRANTAGGGGGGVISLGTVLILNNSTVSDNTTTNTSLPGTISSGGGIYASGGVVTLSSSTISGNTASLGVGLGGLGGGIYNYSSSSVVTLRNTILAGNTASVAGPDCSGDVSSSGYNLIGNTSGCTFAPGLGDLTDVDPELGPLEGSPSYHPLLPDSPAINAGNPAGCADNLGDPLPVDQRGAPRVERCDIGAYEAGLAATKQANGTFSPGGLLTYTITLSNEEANTNLTNVSVHDTLPTYITYVANSYTATNGTGGESGGIITWSGTVFANTNTVMSFSAVVNDEVLCSVIANTAVMHHGGSYEFGRQVAEMTPCQICSVTKHPANPALSVGPSGSWDDDDVWSPAVLKEGGGYKMWYTGDDGTNPSRIGLATSTDGITWTKAVANPVLSPGPSWETGGIRAGGVISDSGLYKLWYTGFDSGGVGRIGYATSPDGVAWTEYGSPILDVGASGSWEDDDVLDPTVIKEGSTYHMWYSGYDGITNRIGHATSSNGTTWTRDLANPVLDVGSPGGWDWLHVYGPSVIRYNDTFLMWYSGGTLPPARQTGYALSPDGSAWTRGGMLIPEGGAGTFDADSADYPSALADGDQFKVWYSGLNASGTYNIGYATAEVCAAAAPPANSVHLPIVLQGGAATACPAYYADDFSDPGSGWPVDDDADRRFAYTGGQYQMWLKKPSLGWSVTPGAQATDFAAAVSARRASGSSGGYAIRFGINEDWSQFYEFYVEANRYSIWKYDSGWTALRNPTASSYIKTGTNWNRLKVIRAGTNISVYANNQYLTTVADGSFIRLGRIGLAAYSASSAALDARFDDFALYPAECGVSAAGIGFEMGEPGIHEGPVPPGLDQAP
jgi:uncharacterized repeat protein (TIGR01451 family)